ncbi:hypothetical protein D3C73_1386890 [compost metagenome]
MVFVIGEFPSAYIQPNEHIGSGMKIAEAVSLRRHALRRHDQHIALTYGEQIRTLPIIAETSVTHG